MSLRTLGWAAYLAVSWTWCIGMFFPVLLVRDYGIWGFVVFAVPNVVGAAAMGWVLCRDGMSEHLVHRHRHAMVAFSAVTAAFHGYWLTWLAYATGIELLAGVGLIAVFLLSALPYLLRTSDGPAYRQGLAPNLLLQLSAVTIFWSWIVAALLGGNSELRMVERTAETSELGVAFLLLPCVLGFALCPYLDLTFHDARQRLGARLARWGFGIGFCVLFLSMILLTLGYSGMLSDWMQEAVRRRESLIASAFALHVGLQSMLTLMFHAGRTRAVTTSPVGFRLYIVSIALGIIVYVASLIPSKLGIDIAGLSIGELIYRCFMVFYGLVFPAYVWLAMWPTRDGHSGIKGRDGRRKRLVLAGVIGLALPFYWMGFIERQEPWLVGGVAVVLLGRLFVRRPAKAP